MIGQIQLKAWVLHNKSTLPHFIALVGDVGMGKTMLSKYIASEIEANFAVCGIKVDEIREMIDTAYTVKDKTVYCIRNADTMTSAAQNALLKIVEEPPKNAYFIITFTDKKYILSTIKSRAYVLTMQDYTIEELYQYLHETYCKDMDENTKKLYERFVYDVCGSMRDIDLVVKYGADFFEYVALVYENIATVESANAFKSSDKLALKGEEDKYDLRLFWTAFNVKCIMDMIKDAEQKRSTKWAYDAVLITVSCLTKLSRIGINKQHLYDKWVFEIRKAWS